MTNEEFIQSVALQGEEWREVPGLEDVCIVSDLGRIISKGRFVNSGYGTIKWKQPKLQVTKAGSRGYAMVSVCKQGVSRQMLVHRLVAAAFIPNPENKPEIDHIDTDRTNNKVSNLRWCTKQENRMNPISYKRNNESLRGKPRPHKYNPVIAIKDGIVTHSYKSAKFATSDGFNPDSIYQCCKSKRKTYRGMIWMYLSDYESLVQYFKELHSNPK